MAAFLSERRLLRLDEPVQPLGADAQRRLRPWHERIPARQLRTIRALLRRPVVLERVLARARPHAGRLLLFASMQLEYFEASHVIIDHPNMRWAEALEEQFAEALLMMMLSQDRPDLCLKILAHIPAMRERFKAPLPEGPKQLFARFLGPEGSALSDRIRHALLRKALRMESVPVECKARWLRQQLASPSATPPRETVQLIARSPSLRPLLAEINEYHSVQRAVPRDSWAFVAHADKVAVAVQRASVCSGLASSWLGKLDVHAQAEVLAMAFAGEIIVTFECRGQVFARARAMILDLLLARPGAGRAELLDRGRLAERPSKRQALERGLEW